MNKEVLEDQKKAIRIIGKMSKTKDFAQRIKFFIEKRRPDFIGE